MKGNLNLHDTACVSAAVIVLIRNSSFRMKNSLLKLSIINRFKKKSYTYILYMFSKLILD